MYELSPNARTLARTHVRGGSIVYTILPGGSTSILREWCPHLDSKDHNEIVVSAIPSVPEVTFGVIITEPREDHIITPRLGTITVEAPTARLHVTPRAPVLPWLDSAAVFIPKTIREPFLGDLHEDVAVMAAAGRSRTAVRWAAISQIMWLTLQWLWFNVVLMRRG